MTNSTTCTPNTATTGQVIVVGVGTVGTALLDRLCNQEPTHTYPHLIAVANSKGAYRVPAWRTVSDIHDQLNHHTPHATLAEIIAEQRSTTIPLTIVDATASAQIAAQHQPWLAQGIHVVTANKTTVGGSLHDWQAVKPYTEPTSSTRYGYTATVGAGLPALSSIARLAATETITGIEGVLSGSLAWLLQNYHPDLAISDLVHQAVTAGICEPDPMIDLSGIDVHRKLLTLARTAGLTIDDHNVHRTPLIAEAAGLTTTTDTHFANTWKSQTPPGHTLVYRARCHRTAAGISADVGPVVLPTTHPLAQHGVNNVIRVFSTRYPEHPLVIAGPGAGPEVTAAALIDDLPVLAGLPALVPVG